MTTQVDQNREDEDGQLAHQATPKAVGHEAGTLFGGMPEASGPEYKSWPLEKLQSEYFRANLHRISAEMAVHDLEAKFRVVEQFLDALTAVTDLVKEDSDDK